MDFNFRTINYYMGLTKIAASRDLLFSLILGMPGQSLPARSRFGKGRPGMTHRTIWTF